MEREIKFKRLMLYKDDGALSWTYSDASDCGGVFTPLPAEASAEWASPILEFSGMMINGVDIYEGDKGKNEVAEWEVIFNKGCFCVKLKGEADRDTYIALRAVQGFKYSGNIYEDKFKK